MSHKDPHHVSRVRYQRRVERYVSEYLALPTTELEQDIANYEADVGKFQLFLARIGLIHEPAETAARRVVLNSRKVYRHE